MALSKDDVRKVARLSRLALGDEELESLSSELGRIVDYVEQLQELPVDDVEPLSHAVPLELRRREDRVQPGVAREGLEGSQGYEDGLVRVPRIVE